MKWILTVTFTPGMEGVVDDLSGDGVHKSRVLGVGKFEYSYTDREMAEQARIRMLEFEVDGIYSASISERKAE